jgi:hypothetical protein
MADLRQGKTFLMVYLMDLLMLPLIQQVLGARLPRAVHGRIKQMTSRNCSGAFLILFQPGYDPINSLSDSTIEEIHPVTAKPVEDYARSKRPRLVDGLPRNIYGLTAAQPDPFDDPSAKLLGLSSSKPAYPQQTQPRYVQPQPAVLELPKGSFTRG